MSEVCKFYLHGVCKFGKRCRYLHVGRSLAPTPSPRSGPRSEPIGGHPYYVPLPKDLPGPKVAGMRKINLRRIEEGLLPRIVHIDLEPDLGKIKVRFEEPDEELFQEVKEKLEHLFASLRIRGGEEMWNRVMMVPDGLGTRSDVFLRFVKYEDNLLEHFRTNPCYQEGAYVLRCVGKSSHSDNSLNSEEAVGHSNGTDEKLASRLFIEPADVTDKLHVGLKWIQGELKQNRNLRGKLEIRFGRKIWHSLPKEVLEKEMNLVELEGLLDSKARHNGMNTSIDGLKVDSLLRELENHCNQKPHVIEIYDFNVTLPTSCDPRMKADVRVIAKEDDTLEVIRVKKNGTKAITIDVLCVQRHHDCRLDLSYYELMHKHDFEYSCVKLVDSMSITEPGSVGFQPCTDMWKVNLLRYARRYTYVLEETFLITISEVKEYKVDWESYGRENKGQLLTVNWEALAGHWELELNNILWECTFAEAIGQSPEEALSIYMKRPSVDAAVLHPLAPESLISHQDLQNVLQNVEWLIEQLE